MLAFTILLAIPFQLQLVGLGAFIFLVWYFILRKYRSLGLRMFFLFSAVAAMAAYWLYCDIQDEKSMVQNGHLLTATVLEKNKLTSGTGSTIDNQITVFFQYPEGKTRVISTSEYISNEEFSALTIGQHIAVLYNPVKEQVYYTVSFSRYKTQQWILYALPMFFFLIGLIFGIVFRNYEVGIHEDTGDEYLERDGKIILDEKGNITARTLKRLNIAWKLIQIFR
ncbi:DUF3592 domain-containing protein [Spirosoma sp. HMF4905]|uniref:DUF3592 domain-containing protein n=1 Tax=Spirosoma arboris TaxID=2682092 RepID=A0A7K1SA08_9BACT|nr:DUF3592 domain-containing protein [Spirosoma arboris]MVM30673.1 DUF3592 domain-containing protein [Spirosoma arboris]